MPQVDVSDIEDLEKLARLLNQAGESFSDRTSLIDERLTTINDAIASHVQRIGERMDDARREYQAAGDAVSHANAALSSANAELSDCYSSGTDDDPPSCCAEEREVASCEDDCREAERRFAKAEEDLQKLEMISSKANDINVRTRQVIEQIHDRIRSEQSWLLASFDRCCTELKRAHGKLESYVSVGIDSNIESSQKVINGDFPTGSPKLQHWLAWKPGSGLITPTTLAARFDIGHEMGVALGIRFVALDTTFRKHIDRLQSQMRDARGPVDLQRVQQAMKCHLTGRYAELLASHALAPLGNRVDEQRTERVSDGRATRLDLVVEDVVQTVLLGRGDRVLAQQGSNLAFEIKTGTKSYLLSELEHMCHQAAGHRLAADASAVLCTKDIRDLSSEEQRLLRDRLRDAGSPILALLPRKEKLDAICVSLLRDYKSPTEQVAVEVER